jgi:hypothetical protein
MNDCIHQAGFHTESSSISGIANAYVIRCNQCQMAINIISKGSEHEITEIRNIVREIQSQIVNLR